jgi:hypothetical protein
MIQVTLSVKYPVEHLAPIEHPSRTSTLAV